MADADSSYIDLAGLVQVAQLKRLSNAFFDLSCELDSLAQVTSHDESSPFYHLGSLLLRFSGRLSGQVEELQSCLSKVPS